MKMILLLFFFFSFANAKIHSSKTSLGQLAYFQNQGKTPKQIHKENLAHLDKFVAIDVDDRFRLLDFDSAKNLDPKDAKGVLSQVSSNPVVSLWAYEKYDPFKKGIGFCFGRAMFVHLELAMRGFDRDMIKKAFVIGPMKTGDGSTWGWHVTTIAQSKDKKGNEIWLAVDPITGLMTLEAWYNLMRNQFSTDKKLRIYITEAGKFGPTSGGYDEYKMSVSFYNNYFSDMMDWFEKESGQPRYTNPVEEYQP